MTGRRRLARILTGLVLAGGPVVCAFAYDPPPEPEPVVWLCSADKPRCIAMSRDASQVEPGGPPSVRLDLPGGPADHGGDLQHRPAHGERRTPGHPPTATTEAPATALPGAAGTPTSTTGA